MTAWRALHESGVWRRQLAYKVKGISYLRVADASVMPDCIRANTNVTSMTIGEKVAEFIKEGR